MPEIASSPVAALSAWEQLVDALGCEPGTTATMLAAEAADRVNRKPLPWAPGRPGGSYSNQVAAACDHRLWLLEMERGSAESVAAAAFDDVQNDFADRSVYDRALADVEALRSREAHARELFPLADRAALEIELRECFDELRKHMPTPDRVRYDETPIAPSTMRAFNSVNDDYRAEDLIAKAHARDVSRENARDRATAYDRAEMAVASVSHRISEWERVNPKLVRCAPGVVL
jgi:hypothetical protein